MSMATRTYHHGDLPSALRAATVELITERGPTGFSLREVARRAGVSHAAPAHHFGTSKGLLTSVAAEGFETLVAAFDEAVDGIEGPVERLNAMGKAYVRTALQHPGHFGVMCTDELIDDADEAFVLASTGAYQRLLAAVTAIRDAHNPALDIDAAATMTWSAVHGYAVLHSALPGVAEKNERVLATMEDTMNSFTRMMMDGYRER
jgi:AcrR family transcriptional regulator